MQRMLKWVELFTVEVAGSNPAPLTMEKLKEWWLATQIKLTLIGRFILGKD